MNLSEQSSQKNYNKIKKELEDRKRMGIGLNKLSGMRLDLKRFIDQIKNNFPNEFRFLESLSIQLSNSNFSKASNMYVAIPVVGTGNQEKSSIIRTLEKLMENDNLELEKIQIVVFVNRPEGKKQDDTYDCLCKSYNSHPNISIIQGEIPESIGRVDGAFSKEMAIGTNQVPIGFIRDALTYSIVKKKTEVGNFNDEMILQMDADFYGFKKGSLSDIVSRFKNEAIHFLQAGSYRDGDTKTADIPGLSFGADLMHYIPKVLKNMYNKSRDNTEMHEILFGSAIQCGIEVPQVQKISNLIFAGGYGLTRISHNELDMNLRLAGLTNPKGLVFDDTVFNRDNRRAISSYLEYGNPPIIQRKDLGFKVDDSVRSEKQSYGDRDFSKEEITKILNTTLSCFYVPSIIFNKNDILDILMQIGFKSDSEFIEVFKQGYGQKIKCEKIGSEDLTYIQNKYTLKKPI